MITPSTIPEQRTNVVWRMGLSCMPARTPATCHPGTPEGLSSTLRILYISFVRNDITAAPEDFQSRLRTLLGLRGAVLTDDELSQMAESYARCGGKGPWDVRQYVARGGAGARGYRAARGHRDPDRFRRAAARPAGPGGHA